MAYSCPQSIRGCAVRITRLNECGVPLDPLVPNSRIQFAAFTEVTLSPDTEDGANITMKNACGQICIRDKDIPRLLGFDVKLVMCGVPLPALEMLLDTTLLHGDTPGDFKGAVLRESKSAAAPNPKMFEVWSKNANRTQCGVGGVGAAVYVQWLMAHTKNWEIDDDLSFSYEDPLTFGLSGYVENNPNWFPSWPGATFTMNTWSIGARRYQSVPSWAQAFRGPAGSAAPMRVDRAGPLDPPSISALERRPNTVVREVIHVNKYASVFGLLLLGLSACSASSGGGGTGTDSDAATTADTASTADSASNTDAAPTADASTGTDASTATDGPAANDARADSATSMYGRCGQTVVTRLCGCGMDATCQGNALQSSQACVQCYGQAINGCCPTQAMMLQTCAMNMGCTDQACLTTMCRMQYNALQTCFAGAQQTMESCQMLLAGCFGSFPPACM